MKTLIVFLIFITFNTFFVHAEYEEEDILIISYEYAVERVISNSLAISDIETRLYPMRNRLAAMRLVLSWLERRHIPHNMPENNRELPGELWRLRSMTPERARDDMIEETRLDITGLIREIEVLEFQQANIALSLENQLRNAIFAYIDARNSIEIQKRELLIEEESVNHINIRYDFGMVSRNAVRLAEMNLNQSRLRLEESLLNLISLSMNLRLLLAIEYEIYIEIDTDISFEKDESAIIMSPTVRTLQITVDERSDDLQAFLYETARERRRRQEMGWPLSQAERREIDFQQSIFEYHYNRAVAERNMRINTMQNSLYNAINDLETLTSGRIQLYAELEHALRDLETAYFNLGLGRVTDHSLNQTRLNIQRIEHRLERNSFQIWLLIFRLQNPSLL